jgi:purine-nucleoside phosphorylase
MPATLIVSAWEPELAPLRRLLDGKDLRGVRRAVALAAAGVGAVDAAVGAARAIAAARARRVIFVGTAGVYPTASQAPAIGVAAVAGAVHLVSTAALAGSGYLPGPLAARADSTPALARALRGTGARAPLAIVACPLAITRSLALARRIAGATGAALENLEVFAVARAAAAAGADFGAALGVSNRVGPRAHAEWRANHEVASEAACLAVAAYLASAVTAPTRSTRRRR